MLSISHDGRLSPDPEACRRLAEHVALAVEEAARASARAKGGRRFWASVAETVMTRRGADGSLTVGAWHRAAGFRHRGGVIAAPGRGPGALGRRALAIPLGRARKGRWSTVEAEQRGLRLFRAGDVLMGRRGSHGRAEPLFLLRRRVTQRPDPWFPEGAALEAAVRRGVDAFLRTLT